MPQYGFNIKKKSLMEDKRKYKVQRSTLVGIPKRIYLTSEFVVVKKWRSCTGLYACDYGQ